MEEITKVEQKVREYVSRNSYLIPKDIIEDKDSLEHIVDVGTSIMCMKWEIHSSGGSFARAVVENDLDNSVSYADMDCIRCLKFFVTMKLSLGYGI
jgi:hypothetical protein